MFFKLMLRLLTVIDVSPVHNLNYTEDYWTSPNYR